MSKMVLSLLTVFLFTATLFAENWEQFWEGEDALQVVPMAQAPAPLANGGEKVGLLQDADGSYSGNAIAITGGVSLRNYTIEADVYCYVNHDSGSAYTGILFYADSAENIYYKLVADFDGNDRFRLYNNQFSMATFTYTYHEAISATGLYSTDAWHHMKVEINTLEGDSATSFTCYFDGAQIGDALYIDNGDDQTPNGKFGLFSGQMDSDGIPAYFDNIVVTDNYNGAVIFNEDFEDNSSNSDLWENFWEGEDDLKAVTMGDAPANLATGGSKVGLLQDVDGSYSGNAIAITGGVSLRNYTIEADVYCYVNHDSGSAYTGILFYADSAENIYYKLVADFDGNDRFRLYNNQFSMATFTYTYHEAISATGLYSTDAWHHMKVEINTLEGDSATSFTCYFDGAQIGDALYIDNGDDQTPNGKFGLFSGQMDSDGIPAYFDNIVVTDNYNGAVIFSEDFENWSVETAITDNFVKHLPITALLYQNYPNPFNPTTTIRFELQNPEFVNLTVYNVVGEEVKTLISNNMSAGLKEFKWDATDNTGNKVAGGIYFYSLKTAGMQLTKKMILIK